jgi:hypothetical protein
MKDVERLRIDHEDQIERFAYLADDSGDGWGDGAGYGDGDGEGFGLGWCDGDGGDYGESEAYSNPSDG